MEDDHLDPRIHVELEKLNNATNEINHLEKELDDSQSEFRLLLSSRTAELNKLIQKFSTSIELSRPFYTALQEAKSAHKALHEATINYQRANVVHEEAKRRVGATEDKLKMKLKSDSEKSGGDNGLDNGLQEILNIATLKFQESSKTKQDFSILHKKLTDEFTSCEKRVYNLEKKLYKHILKSQSYFELKDKLNEELTSIKQRIQTIQKNLLQSKCDYAASLKHLELISEEIHFQRQNQQAQAPKKKNINVEPQNQNINNNTNNNDTLNNSAISSTTCSNNNNTNNTNNHNNKTTVSSSNSTNTTNANNNCNTINNHHSHFDDNACT